MSESRYRRLFITLACLINLSNGCQIDGVVNWLVPVHVSVHDVYRGNFYTAGTSNILEITSVTHAEGLNSGPYIDVRLEGSEFIISTNNAYAQYEENETAMSMGVTVNMKCVGDTSRSLVFMINVNDTNNNAPQFKPSDKLEFTIAPPVPPGFLITGCLNDIIARDIDLTTQRVDFEVDPNPYFEISYDADSSTEVKEFKAILQTTKFIRSLPEPVTITIRATDVDNTGDPPLTTEATLRIIGDREFELPEEPVFSQAFYFAEISEGQLLHEPISLLQGYSNEVIFELVDGEYSEFFNILSTGNQVTLGIQSILPDNLLQQTYIYLAVRAERNLTSGASATVILQMPEPRQLGFEKNIYYGNIRDNVMTLDAPIVLNIGYSEDVSFEVNSDFDYFIITNTGNQASLSIRTQIPENIVQANDYIYLSITASGINTESASASVILQILKDDTNTPVFSKLNYKGSYSETNNLVVEDITLVQGFDSTVRFQLEGEYRQYFSHNNEGNNITLLLTSDIPEDLIFNEKSFVLNIRAEKDLSVGGSASILINFPRALTEPAEMSFSKNTYIGSLENGQFSLETIILSKGFVNGTIFSISGEHQDYFNLVDTKNSIDVEISNAIPENIIDNNNYLTFEVIAQRERAVTAVANVVIDIIKEEPESPTILLFSSRTYVGSILDNIAEVPSLSLQEPISEELNLTLSGEYESYFSILQESNQFTVTQCNNLPEEAINNTFIILEVEAAHSNAISGFATIVLEIVKESTPLIPVFERAYYTGQFSNQDGLLFEDTIQLIQGYEENVNFTLVGDDSVWFRIVQIGDSAFLTTVEGINEIEDRTHLVFSVVAEKSGALNGEAAIVIALTDRSTAISLKFLQSYYTGSIENNSLSLSDIHLGEGYSQDLNVTFGGEYSEYFDLQHVNGTFSLTLICKIPAEITDANDVLINTIEVTNGNAHAHTVIIIDVVKINTVVEILNFEEKYYSGSYLAETGLDLEEQIILLGNFYDSTVFSLAGEFSEWFGLIQIENTLTITLNDTIPQAVIENNQFIVFFITASKEGAISASSTIIISLLKVNNSLVVLSFQRNSYTGTIESNVSTLEPITLIEGYSNDVNFTLNGDLSSYFTVTPNSNVATITLDNAIPEQEIPKNGIIILELQASAPQSISAHATIVFNVIREEVTTDVLKFGESYYSGSYNESEGLRFENNLLLSEGHSDDVHYSLDGDQSQWFRLLQTESAVTLTVLSPISAAVLNNNQYLLFAIISEKAGAINTSAAIVISLDGDYSEATLLGFENTSYIGSIQNNTSTLEQITLIEGYTIDVIFELSGDLNNYFTVTPNGNVVTITLDNAIPEQEIPKNEIIILELQASAPQSISAHATIVFNVIREEVTTDVLKFGESYYSGSYNESEGLRFENNLLLSEGHSDDVHYSLDGDQSQWFRLLQTESAVTLTVLSPIPAAVLNNNQYLLFAIIAEKAGAINTSAAIVISLDGDYSEATLLGFENTSYIGSIQNNTSTLEQITLIEGYSIDVIFELSGDLNNYFTVTPNGNVVTITLDNAIPEQEIPKNEIIILELQASAPQSISAHATIVFNVIREEVTTDVLKFGESYYSGSYNESEGLRFENNLLLSEGHSDDVYYSLDGDQSQWFRLLQTESAVTLTVLSPIPAAVLNNNQHLLFAIIAKKAGAINTSAAIVISLDGDYSEATLLGFENTSYIGSIQNNTSTLEQITLIEGYTIDVIFELSGDLNNYFTVTPNSNVVTITLVNAIPEQEIPKNGIIILELQASAPQSISAHASIVFNVIREEVTTDVLKFGESYYSGSYNESEGLRFENNLLLSEGHSDDVRYSLDGDQSHWFRLLQTESAVTLTVLSPIPAAVLNNNQYLLFAIIAEKARAINTSAAIVISLDGEYSEATLLGFENTSYIGSIQNNTSTLEQITLIEGYTIDVVFELSGDLNNYFTVTPNSNVVTITLDNAIPEQEIPKNGIIILELQASAPQSISAHATIVFNVIREEVTTDVLKFGEIYYSGSYNESEGLRFENNLLLSEGHSDDVRYSLDGDQSRWFRLLQTESTVTLTMLSPIPAAVLNNNQHLVFAINAEKAGAINTSAAIVISLDGDYSEATLLGFENTSYIGSIQNNTSTLEQITLIEGYTIDVIFELSGDLNNYFTVTPNSNVVTITLDNAIPEQEIPKNGIILLELQASALQSISAHATIVFNVIREEVTTDVLKFGESYYSGSYNESEGLRFENNLLLSEGHSDDVRYSLDGDQSQWFRLLPTESAVTLTVLSPIPAAVLNNNQHLLFAIIAEKAGAVNTSAAIVISLDGDYSEATLLGFENTSYIGSIQNNTSTLEQITLIEGYTIDVVFELSGDLNNYFTVTPNGNVVTITLDNAIPEQEIPKNGIIILELQASAPQSISAHATIVFNVIREEVTTDVLKFGESYYSGSYNESKGLRFENNLLLSEGHSDDVRYSLDGDQSRWFRLLQTESTVTLTVLSPIPAAVLNNNQHLLFAINAEKAGAINTSAAIVISLDGDYSEATLLGFENTSYIGSIQNNTSTLEQITLIEGYTIDVIFELSGDLNNYFTVTPNSNVVTITLDNAIPEQEIPKNGIIILELQASAPQSISAHATIVFNVIREEVTTDVLKFGESYYSGSYNESEGLRFENNLLLSEGHSDDVRYSLDGDQSQWFRLLPTESAVTLTVLSPIPAAVLNNNQHLLFAIIAEKAGAINTSAAIVISLNRGASETAVNFNKNIFEGLIQNGILQHEEINVVGYNGTEILLFGEYANIFSGTVENGVVSIESTGSLTFPDQVTYVALELRVGSANAVLILRVVISEIPNLPTVSFSSSSYVFRVKIDQTGVVGQVQATADNGESLTYSPIIENAHLQQRLSITVEGNVQLTAPANSGIYSFQVIATTTISRVEGITTVQLFVEAASICGSDIVVPPLLILDRDEEEPHANLVVLNGTQFAGCQYTLTNRWPEDQSWLYVDENGLHTNSIDREHESIAFMALSQVQVELVLHCENDTNDIRRFKRDVNPRLDWLGQYDYGSNKWILTDNIHYNSRRTLVNLIVNDINDNAPIFIGKYDEPIPVGYPIEELEGSILPRALVELTATDSDIGENAALRYWSSEDTLSVAPTTGFVHVRNGARLEHDTRLTVHATDRNGDGLTGSINLLVRLLDMSHIVVVTVQDAFLDDENTILSELSTAVGYEVKALRAEVVSNNALQNDVVSRIKRDLTSSNGTSLQIYIYGLIEREPVEVDKLTTDINKNATTVAIASTVSLEDHLISHKKHSGRDIGLLVSTIVLSVLLFILIVAIAIWYILKWRKNSYGRFSEDNSLSSRNDSVQELPKVEPPRLNIEELKRSERRLQEMLDAPMEEIPAASTSGNREKEDVAQNIVAFDTTTPIVVKDKLKSAEESDDEFGEKQKDRRKSVVTFNENVEKIIHLDDSIDDESLPEYEVYKF